MTVSREGLRTTRLKNAAEDRYCCKPHRQWSLAVAKPQRKRATSECMNNNTWEATASNLFNVVQTTDIKLQKNQKYRPKHERIL